MHLIFDIETEPYPPHILERMGADPDKCLLDASTACVCAIGYRWAEATVRNRFPEAEPAEAQSAKRKVQILGTPGPVEYLDGACLSTWDALRDCRSRYGSGSPELDLTYVANEATMLELFWEAVNVLKLRHEPTLVGYNSHGFDLPLLIRRSILLGVAWPAWLRSRNKWWADVSVDLRDVWGLGAIVPHASRPKAKKPRKKAGSEPVVSESVASKAGFPQGGLDRLARLLGLGGKNGDGTMFWSQFRSPDPAQQAAAVGYLVNDVVQTEGVWRRMVG